MKHVLFIFSTLLLFSSCSTTPSGTIKSSELLVEAQYQDLNLDTAIIEGSKYVIARLPTSSKIAIVSIQSPTTNLTNYISDTIAMYLVNENSFTIIERSEISAIQTEQNFQLSGEVSDKEAVSIGNQLGAQFIITGSVLPLGEKYSLRVKIINVETAEVIGTKIYKINKDVTLIALLIIHPEQQKEASTKNSPQTVINNTTITNNNETTINGDVYINKPGGFSWE